MTGKTLRETNDGIIYTSARREPSLRALGVSEGAMARLKQLAPRIGKAPERVASAGSGPDRLARRDATVPWRKWYKTARWRALRWAVLVRDGFTCRRCNRFGGAETSQLVADHVRPHRGDAALFWDAANLQCLCKTCHDRDKQREERQAPGLL